MIDVKLIREKGEEIKNALLKRMDHIDFKELIVAVMIWFFILFPNSLQIPIFVFLLLTITISVFIIFFSFFLILSNE